MRYLFGTAWPSEGLVDALVWDEAEGSCRAKEEPTPADESQISRLRFARLDLLLLCSEYWSNSLLISYVHQKSRDR